MSAQAEEQKLKKRLQAFLSELGRVGTVKGFKHLAMYMRGREEMIISVVNQPMSPDNSYGSEPVSPLASSFTSQTGIPVSVSGSFTSGNLPYDKRSLILSQRSQRSLSGYGDEGIGLPPASPSDTETTSADSNNTIFLLAGYSRYNCPYVWVRSNHQRLVRVRGGSTGAGGEGGEMEEQEATEERDSPLKLKTTRHWREQVVQVWDILAEIVKLCTYPPPLNPFAVDYQYFDNLPLPERLLAQVAMLHFLQRVILSKKEDKYYTAKVLDDLQMLTKSHFRDLQLATQQEILPIMQQKQQQQQQKHAGSTGNKAHHKAPLTYRYQTGML